jgi:hypothetical protein
MIVTSQYMNILARLALQSPELLLHFLRSLDTSSDIVSRFVDKWAGQKVNTAIDPANGAVRQYRPSQKSEAQCYGTDGFASNKR